MKKSLLAAGAGLMLALALPASAAPIILNNGNFSSGFAGWTLAAPGGSSTTFSGPGTLGPPITSGAQLTNDSGLSQAAGEADLGLTAGSLTPFGRLATQGGTTTGTVLYQSITSGLVGDTISFKGVFNAEDVNLYDFGAASLAGSGSAQQLQLIGAGDGSVHTLALFTFTLTQNATALNPLIFGFASYNTLDSGILSSISVSQQQQPVPEIDPHTAALPVAFALGSLLLLADRRKRQAT